MAADLADLAELLDLLDRLDPLDLAARQTELVGSSQVEADFVRQIKQTLSSPGALSARPDLVDLVDFTRCRNVHKLYKLCYKFS